MKEIKFENGDEAVINIASFMKCTSLKSKIAKALLKEKIELASIDLEKPDSIFKAILTIDSDEDVFNAIFDCLAKSTYNKERITADTFENEKARENYYEIVIECLKINLSSFIKPLISQLTRLTEKTTESQAVK